MKGFTLITRVHTRVIIRPPQRLCPAIDPVMTHEMASVSQTLLGSEVMDAQPHRQQIKEAIDFLVDGF